jgi:hypothetical protein
MNDEFQDITDCAMAQTVSPRPLTAEARILTRVIPRGISGGQVALGQGFFLSELLGLLL